jgi:uncharacterized cupredoxin-like copper-binding protein
MPRLSNLAVLTLLAVMLSSPWAQAQILDPAVHRLVRLEPLEFGGDADSSKMEPREYRLKVGQGYRWKIKTSDLNEYDEYAFVAPAFIRNIWIRKIEVGDPAVEIKAVTFDELEFESGGEAEVFFVAVRPGTYEFGSKGMIERGMVGKIIVESADTPSAAPAAGDHKGGDDDKGSDGDDDKK